MTVCAQSSSPSGSSVGQCDPKIVSACAAVADELAQARLLIKAQADEIIALDNRLSAEKEQTQLHREKVSLLDQQMVALEGKIKALEDANTALVSLKARLDERVAKLEQQKRAANKRSLYFAAAGVVIGFLATR